METVNELPEGWLDNLIDEVVESIFEIMLEPDNVEEFAEIFNTFRKALKPISYYPKNHKQYYKEMTKVKDAKGEEKDGSKTTV